MCNEFLYVNKMKERVFSLAQLYNSLSLTLNQGRKELKEHVLRLEEPCPLNNHNSNLGKRTRDHLTGGPMSYHLGHVTTEE